MRIVLLILLASAAALALTALLARPDASASGRPMRLVPSVAALRPAPGDLRVALPVMRPMPDGFAPPLTERTLSASRRAEPIEPSLVEAMDRIEPVIDPTRLDGPFVAPAFRIWPGTASLVDVFGEHWRLASDDANVQARVRSYALAWHRVAPLACDDFVKNRAHALGAPALSALTRADCERMGRRSAGRRENAAPVPIVAAPLSLAVFAAPPPGARMASVDFWAAQKARVEATRALLQRKWQAARSEHVDVGLRD